MSDSDTELSDADAGVSVREASLSLPAVSLASDSTSTGALGVGGLWPGGWGSSLWSSIQETAKDFTDSITAENEDTISTVKEQLTADNVSKMGGLIADTLTKAVTTTTVADGDETEEYVTPRTKSSGKRVEPKTFEKERATYALDPLKSKKHNVKFAEFCEGQLAELSEAELCESGREKMEGNRAIETYFDTLVPSDIDEVRFWQRYFYWRHRYESRERMLSRHASAASMAAATMSRSERDSSVDTETDSVLHSETESDSVATANSDLLVLKTIALDSTTATSFSAEISQKSAETESESQPKLEEIMSRMVITDTSEMSAKEKEKEKEAIEELEDGSEAIAVLEASVLRVPSLGTISETEAESGTAKSAPLKVASAPVSGDFLAPLESMEAKSDTSGESQLKESTKSSSSEMTESWNDVTLSQTQSMTPATLPKADAPADDEWGEWE